MSRIDVLKYCEISQNSEKFMRKLGKLRLINMCMGQVVTYLKQKLNSLIFPPMSKLVKVFISSCYINSYRENFQCRRKRLPNLIGVG